jgi:hypothetical protein
MGRTGCRAQATQAGCAQRSLLHTQTVTCTIACSHTTTVTDTRTVSHCTSRQASPHLFSEVHPVCCSGAPGHVLLLLLLLLPLALHASLVLRAAWRVLPAAATPAHWRCCCRLCTQGCNGCHTAKQQLAGKQQILSHCCWQQHAIHDAGWAPTNA